MPALLELQCAFATSMLHEEDDAVCGAVVDDGFAAAERLRIYRNTCRSTLIEALRMTYPHSIGSSGATFSIWRRPATRARIRRKAATQRVRRRVSGVPGRVRAGERASLSR